MCVDKVWGCCVCWCCVCEGSVWSLYIWILCVDVLCGCCVDIMCVGFVFQGVVSPSLSCVREYTRLLLWQSPWVSCLACATRVLGCDRCSISSWLSVLKASVSRCDLLSPPYCPPQGAFSRCYKLTDMSTSAVFALKVVPRGGAGRLRLRGKVRPPPPQPPLPTACPRVPLLPYLRASRA